MNHLMKRKKKKLCKITVRREIVLTDRDSIRDVLIFFDSLCKLLKKKWKMMPVD